MLSLLKRATSPDKYDDYYQSDEDNNHDKIIQAVEFYNAGNMRQALLEIEKVEEASKKVLELLADLEEVEK